MYLKILIESDLRVLTGMHIGGAGGFSAIGAVDSAVIRDPRTNLPIIPGSSLKGKLRTLLVRSRYGGAMGVSGHEPRYGRYKVDQDPQDIQRLFGSSDPIRASRLQFADAFIKNPDDFKEIGVTEVKFENTIDRVSAIANPRQIERVNSGAVFGVRIVYDAESETEMLEDMQNLAKGMKLLQLDYLGGHGTRGSGRVSFENIKLSVAYPEDSGVSLDRLQEFFNRVQDYELLSLQA